MTILKLCRLFIKIIKEDMMFRKKNGQEFMDETSVDSSPNEKKRKKAFFKKERKRRLIYMKTIWDS